jgi:hypothetical protein
MAKADSPVSRPPLTPGARKRPKATVSSRYLLPLATAMVVGVGFVVYYLTYVQQHREYLLNRDYRVLATLGEQISQTLSNQAKILQSYVYAFEGGEFFYESAKKITTYQPAEGGGYEPFDQGKRFLESGGASTLRAEIRSFAPRLHHVKFNHVVPRILDKDLVKPALVRLDGEWSFQLAAVDNDGDHEASATISLQDLSQSFSSAIGETFDDLLIADEDGVIVFQKQTIGPRFSSLSDLLKNTVPTNVTPGEADKDSNSKAGSGTSGHLIETELAGVLHMVFVEPIAIDLNFSHTATPPQRFTLLGLVPARQFQWQSLAISYQAIILLSSGFLLLCLSIPIVKVLFINERGRLLLREVVMLPLFFAMIAGALTSVCLQMIYFNLRHDDTDIELEDLSLKLQANIKNEITAMRGQLVDACNTPELISDRTFQRAKGNVIRTRVLKTEFQDHSFPMQYAYFSNIFWTDADGRQQVKWSSMDHATPLIDVSRLEFFQRLDSGHEYFFLGNDEPFRFDSVLPPNQDEYVGVLGMRVRDCASGQTETRTDQKSAGLNTSKFAFLTARPLSLIDPTLPLGVGFALVDDEGQVLFHSDKYRNNRENVLVETSNDPELTASLYGHSNVQIFSLDYRGNEVRARVVPISGVYQSPWSLIVYKDARYVQTYDLEVLTMAGVLLIGYLAVPALIIILFYSLARPPYVPGWLWPSESAARIYRFQIVAGAAMLVLSATMVFLRPIEDSLCAAAASGYATVLIVFWSTLRDKPSSPGKIVFGWICRLAALAIVAFALWNRLWGSVAIGLILVLLVFPFAWEKRGRALVLLAVARVMPPVQRQFERLSYRALYNVRALVLLTVVGILPPLSFFRNSIRLEDRLYIRAAQLHAATSWNARRRKIDSLFDATPGLKDKTAGLGTASPALDPRAPPGKPADRCNTGLDFYLDSYFQTTVEQAPPTPTPEPSSGELGDGFLRFAHFLHHSFNRIGAEALGVLRNPAVPVLRNPPVPESAYASKSQSKAGVSGESEEWEWEWKWVPQDKDRPNRPLQLWMHQGAGVSPCSADPINPPNSGGTPEKTTLVVSSSVLPGRDSGTSHSAKFQGRDSAWWNIFTWLAVTAVTSLLFRLVTRRMFLFDLRMPLSLSVEELGKALKGTTNLLVLTEGRQQFPPELAGDEASRIDVRELAAEPAWGEKFDTTKLKAGGTVVVENFDGELASPELNRERLILTERLVARTGKVILVSAVDPFPFLIEHGTSEAGSDACRWAAVLEAFTRTNLGHKSSGVLSEQVEKELPTLWRECSVQPELQRIGEELWLARNPQQPLEPEQVVSEVGERAVQSYYLEWRSSTEAECFVLAGLARDGTVHPGNTAALRQLLRRGLIVRDPQFRIMNESFRRFVLAQAVSMQADWDSEAAGSGWGKARGPLATALVLVGLFLLSTQQQFLQTTSGLLTAAGGCVAVLLRLIGAAQGKSANA